MNQELWEKLPQWQSHKIIRGDQIVAIRVDRENFHPDDSGWRWKLLGGGEVVVSNALANRDAPRRPSEGDFYVVYKGGYESWCPCKEFMEGNDRLE